MWEGEKAWTVSDVRKNVFIRENAFYNSDAWKTGKGRYKEWNFQKSKNIFGRRNKIWFEWMENLGQIKILSTISVEKISLQGVKSLLICI